MRADLSRRGYTVVEIMIALAILTIGTSGVVAMQKVTAVANRDARNLVIADQIARTWVERLRADAVAWNHPSPLISVSDLTETQWLRYTPSSVSKIWIRPPDSPVLGQYFSADSFGNDVPADSPRAIYCTSLRLTWLYGPPETVLPPYLIRAEVRVFWLRDGGQGSVDGAGVAICPDGANPNPAIDSALDRYHFVYVVTAVTQNMARP
jgi:prepilin-type N-terminal cleavage/methylation domain-containing protein